MGSWDEPKLSLVTRVLAMGANPCRGDQHTVGSWACFAGHSISCREAEPDRPIHDASQAKPM